MSASPETQRPFAAFDLDGTLPRWQLYHATADKLTKLGHITKEDFEPIREARMAWKRREHQDSFKEYEHRLVELFTQILPNLTTSQLEEASKEVFDEYKDQVHTYTRGLIQACKSRNYWLFAISGSQTEIVSMMAQHYGFDDYIGTTYSRDGNSFTGEVITPLGAKDRALEDMAKKHRATMIGSIAVGDSKGDIPMLTAVENPIAFNPERSLAEHAEERGWTIVIERKNTVVRMKDGKYELVNPEDESAYIF